MDFIENIKNSIYNPTFYRNIPKESFWSAFTYYLLLCLLVTFFRLVFLSFPIVTGINRTIPAAENSILQSYPSDLQITVRNGHLTVNKPQPYSIPVCFPDNPCEKIVTDTNKPDVDAYLKQKDLLALVTRDTIYLKSSHGSARTYSLSEFGDITVNRNILVQFINQINSREIFFVPLALLGTAVLLYGGFMFKLIYLLILAFILWLLAKKFTPGMTYGQTYKISLHVVTLGIFAALLLDVIGWFLHIYAFPFMETIFSILVFMINFNTAGEKITRKKK